MQLGALVVPAAVTGETEKVQESKRERKWCARRAARRNHVLPHLGAPSAPLAAARAHILCV